jgi:sec-independent protein translocase protein TatC
MQWLKKPLFDALPVDSQKLYFTHLFENFLVHLKVSMVAAFVLTSPFLLWQIWQFVVPGLYLKEKTTARWFIFSSTGLFLLGSGFAYYVVFPIGFRYFAHFGGPQDVPMLTMDAYYSMVLKLMSLFGLAFEFPLVLWTLVRLELLDAESLEENRRWAVIVISAVCAVFAPPDALSMVLLAVPLYGMYEGVIWAAKRKIKKKQQPEALPTRFS